MKVTPPIKRQIGVLLTRLTYKHFLTARFVSANVVSNFVKEFKQELWKILERKKH